MTDNNISYDEVLKPVKEMTMDMVYDYSFAANMPEEKQKEAIRDILSQKYMGEVYLNNHVEPRDVPEFIEKMANSSLAKRTNIILSFAQNVMNTDSNGDRSGSINNIRENYVLKNALTAQFANDMMSFAEQKVIDRTPPEPEKKWWQKAFKKAVKTAGSIVRGFAMASGVVMLAGGSYIVAKTYLDEKNNNNSYGIVPSNNTSKALQNARNKLEKDPKTNYDAFSKLEKKAPVKGQSNMRNSGSMELS
ncbi:MAG: hypothetical protein IJ532_00240 [Alphaproteobacteria bacterium]|nr:hypothetical protein [Alphaproteobacteria bacterium]